MISTFFGLDLALRALQAQQAGVDVTNHNVANANTEGFSRQNVQIATTEPFTVPGMNRHQGPGQVGTGAIAKGIQRARDVFLDVQFRTELGAQRNAESRQDALQEVEVILNEPGTSGLAGLFNEYYRVWGELTNDPGDLPVRTTVVQQSVALAAAFNRADRQLRDVRTNLDGEIVDGVKLANQYIEDVAALNKQIMQVEALGQRANDLRDRRDLALDKLGELVQITVAEQPDASVTVTLGGPLPGGQALVAGITATTLSTADTDADGFQEVRYGGAAALIGNAGLSGKLTARDTNLPDYQAKLDAIAANLITAVNALHTTGYGLDGATGRPFFAGTDAGSMAVDPAIVADPKRIGAAAAANRPGDNTIALGISQLRRTMTPTSESAYNALVSGLGTDNRAARAEVENQEALVGLLERRREMMHGVSLDEETVNLIRYQKAYEAAARLITAADEMLDRLINNTGIVGR
jgi:flagellar hook-associated protein 1